MIKISCILIAGLTVSWKQNLVLKSWEFKIWDCLKPSFKATCTWFLHSWLRGGNINPCFHGSEGQQCLHEVSKGLRMLAAGETWGCVYSGNVGVGVAVYHLTVCTGCHRREESEKKTISEPSAICRNRCFLNGVEGSPGACGDWRRQLPL